MPKQNRERVNIGETARIVIHNNQNIPKVLSELIAIAERGTNIIYLNTKRIKTILEKNKIIRQNFYTYLNRYIDNDFMIKDGESTYMLNPHVAFKCSNPEFITLVKTYEAKKIAILKGEINALKKREKVEKAGNKLIKNVNEILDNSKPFGS